MQRLFLRWGFEDPPQNFQYITKTEFKKKYECNCLKKIFFISWNFFKVFVQLIETYFKKIFVNLTGFTFKTSQKWHFSDFKGLHVFLFIKTVRFLGRTEQWSPAWVQPGRWRHRPASSPRREYSAGRPALQNHCCQVAYFAAWGMTFFRNSYSSSITHMLFGAQPVISYSPLSKNLTL